MALCHPLLLVGSVMSTLYSRISVPWIMMKLWLEILTAHGSFISTGIAGPATHCVEDAPKKSVVLELLLRDPPMRYVPMFSILTAAWLPLGCRSWPIVLASHPWLVNTRQDAVQTPLKPPQVTSLGLAPVVAKVECADLPSGKAGGEQPLTAGKISVLEREPER